MLFALKKLDCGARSSLLYRERFFGSPLRSVGR